MVIPGAPEPSPERVAAWSAVVARPPSVPEKVTTATKPPLPPTLKPATTVSETTLPLVPADPLATPDSGPSVPVAVPSDPAAAAVPLAPPVAAPASVPAGVVAVPDVSVPVAPVVLPAADPVAPAPSSALSPQAASATTGGPAPLVAPSAAVQSAPARGPRGRGGGGAYRPPVTMADLKREVSKAVREERAAQSQSRSMHASPARAAPRQAALPSDPMPVAAPPPQVLVPPLPAPAASAPAPGARLRLPPVPPVAGVEFVAAGGGAAGARYSPHVAGGSAFLAADELFHFLAEALQQPQTRVPEATLGQLSRLAESLHALLLIQVLAHASLPAIPTETFHDRPCETCLDAADQLALLLGPVLAAPAEGGAAAVGQLDEAVWGSRRHLRAGSGAAAIGASTLVVQELRRTLTGVLHALGAHRM
ncbi:unnamed protein product [Closterium sp. Naga37s-1]|nr:unnamed protein product [Closterium sp. Naga37s-1]